MEKLLKIGFKKNTLIINGYCPHFKRGTDLIFLINESFTCRKIVSIERAYHGGSYNVYGVLTDKAPRMAQFDWASCSPTLKLLKIEPLSIAKWNNYGEDLEYIKVSPALFHSIK